MDPLRYCRVSWTIMAWPKHAVVPFLPTLSRFCPDECGIGHQVSLLDKDKGRANLWNWAQDQGSTSDVSSVCHLVKVRSKGLQMHLEKNLEKERVVHISCSHIKALEDSFHTMLKGASLLLPALSVPGLQWVIIIWPYKSWPVCWLLVKWRLVGCFGLLVGFQWCLVWVFFPKAWTLRSSYDLLTVLADTSVQSCLWLLLSGKDRRLLCGVD